MQTKPPAPIVIDDLRGGRNDTDPPMSLPPNQCVEALNIDWKDATLAHKRGGSTALATTGGTAFGSGIQSLIRHLPSGADTTAELYGVDGAGLIKRLAGGTTWADLTLSDAISGSYPEVVGASLNGKLFLGYDSTEDRLHVYDPNLATPRVRRVGLKSGSVSPTAANAGSGSYAASARYYRARFIQTNYNADQNQTTNDDSANLRDLTGRRRLAQGFQLASAGAVFRVLLRVLKTGSPTGPAFLEIHADSAGSPSDTALATSDSLDMTNVGTSAKAIMFTFSRPFLLAASTQYHLVLRLKGSVDASNYLTLRGANASGYASGSAQVSSDNSSGGWGADASFADWWFYIFATFDGTAAARLIRRSEPTPSFKFTPSGSGASVTVTQPDVPSEQETHWELEAGTDNATFYVVNGYNSTGIENGDLNDLGGEAIPIATTTATDVLTDYTAGALSDPVGSYTLPRSGKYVISDGNRLLIAGGFDSGAPSAEIQFTPVLGSADTADDERIVETTQQKHRVSLNEKDGGGVTGLGGPLNGIPYAFKYRQVWKLRPTGDVLVPYLPRKIRDDIGCIAHKTIALGEDAVGREAVYFLSHRGPYRVTFEGVVEYLGRDNEVTWRSVNLAASSVVAHSVFYPDLHQWWLWIATGSANDPDVKMMFDVQRGFPDQNGLIRGGWAKHTGDSAGARCSCLFSHTPGATMSRDLKPHIGRSSGTTILKCDTTDLDDNGTDYQSYITTRPLLTTPDLLRKVKVGESTLLAKAQAATTVAVTINRDFGKETRTHSVSIAAAASETRVVKKMEGSEMGEADVIQMTVGDSAAAESTWTIDALITPVVPQEPR